MPIDLTKKCKHCFEPLKTGKRFCTYKCFVDSKVGKVRTDYHGYKLVHLPSHPLSNSRGKIFEHRLIVMQKLGRLLESTEIVHHKNGLKGDNRIENLEIIVQLPKNGSHKGEVKCPHCEKTFSIR